MNTLKQFILQPLYDLAECLDRQLVNVERPWLMLGLIMVSMTLGWFIYVPVHELLHALGCWITGGTVTELQIAPLYGGALLAKIFPFVVSGSDYAGQLTGFDTGGSDLVYLATDFTPYLLSIGIGLPLMMRCTKRKGPILFGLAVVLAMAPIYNLTGDYYEMGSIVTTRLLTIFSGFGPDIAFEAIRSDDVFRLIEDLRDPDAGLNLSGPGGPSFALLCVPISQVAGLLLALGTYALGRLLALKTAWGKEDSSS